MSAGVCASREILGRAYCSRLVRWLRASERNATIESDVLLGIMERVAYTLMKGLHL